MSKFEDYPLGSGISLAVADLFLMAKASSSFETQKMSIAELEKYFATVTALAAAATGSFTFAQSAFPSATQAGETWLDTDDGKVYVSSGTGTGNWGSSVYQLVLNDGSIDIKFASGAGLVGSDGSPALALASDGSMTAAENIAMASGKGIDFSAGGGSPDFTEVLGTWTPELQSGTGATSSGTWTKTGNMVTVQGVLACTTLGAQSNRTLYNFPFTPVTSKANVLFTEYDSLASTIVNFNATINPGNVHCTIGAHGAAASGPGSAAIFAASAGTVGFTSTYRWK